MLRNCVAPDLKKSFTPYPDARNPSLVADGASLRFVGYRDDGHGPPD